MWRAHWASLCAVCLVGWEVHMWQAPLIVYMWARKAALSLQIWRWRRRCFSGICLNYWRWEGRGIRRNNCWIDSWFTRHNYWRWRSNRQMTYKTIRYSIAILIYSLWIIVLLLISTWSSMHVENDSNSTELPLYFAGATKLLPVPASRMKFFD